MPGSIQESMLFS